MTEALSAGDLRLVCMLLEAGADVRSYNNESYLPAEINFGLRYLLADAFS